MVWLFIINHQIANTETSEVVELEICCSNIVYFCRNFMIRCSSSFSCSQSCTSLSSDGSRNRHKEATKGVATKNIHHVTNPQEDTFSEPILNPNELNELYWTTKTEMVIIR